MMTLDGRLSSWLRKRVHRRLEERDGAVPPTVPYDLDRLLRVIRKGDVVLVEGHGRLSRIIKLFTHSQWSHAALYIGDELLAHAPECAGELIREHGEGAGRLVLEALVEGGVVASPLAKYRRHNLRICRPAGIAGPDLQTVLDHALADLGKRYDQRNILDLALQLLPLDFGPFRRQRAEVCIGACSEFQVMCSGFIARAFHRAGFMIRPVLEPAGDGAPGSNGGRPVLTMQHPSRITPRDFDLSPYFEIVKAPAPQPHGQTGVVVP